MQHLDEGMIHSWLDGALSAEEAALVKAHVDECPQCAAAVAEARGFIAASSRILTALDNVPKGVVPVAARAKPRNWAAWRAAAAVLVVALGSFAVLRERMGTRSSPAEVVRSSAQPTSAGGVADYALTDTVQRESLPTNQTPTTPKILVKPATPPRVASPLDAAKMGNQEPARQDNVSALAAAPQSPVVASDVPIETRESNAVSQSAGAMKGSLQGLSAGVGVVVLSPRPSSAAMSNASAGPTSIRVVGTSAGFGEKRTQYEVAPGDTVVLAEVAAMTLNAAVVTGVGTTRTSQSADTSGTRIQIRGANTRSTVPDTQNRKAPFGTQAAAPPPPSAETLNGVTTLMWIDPASGSMMRLSGRHTAAELLEIKRGIEQLRAAEAAAKKKP
jgi:hypothetical protein